MLDPQITGTMMALAMVFLIVLAIAWLLLPFAMFGLKPRLDKLTEEARRTNRLLEGMRDMQRNG